MGRRRVKKRTHVVSQVLSKDDVASRKSLVSKEGLQKAAAVKKDAEEVGDKIPHSIVVRHGKTGHHLVQLVNDIRNVMMPYTALNLKERKNASIKDYVAISGPLSVSHLLVVQQGSRAPNLKIARLPAGPTVSFRLRAYTLSKQLRLAQQAKFDITTAMLHPPLVVLNNFDENDMENKRHMKVSALTFQSMFPSINVRSAKLKNCRRVLLLHANTEDDSIEFRHYLVQAKPAGESHLVKNLLNSKIPDLGSKMDISDALMANSSGVTPSAASDSEYEDDKLKTSTDGDFRRRKADVPVNKRDALADSKVQSVIQLHEIGPRMTLQVYKVEDGVCTGEVQFHAFKTKTSEEKDLLREEHEQKEGLRKLRREEQNENVKRKREKILAKAEKKKLKSSKDRDLSS